MMGFNFSYIVFLLVIYNLNASTVLAGPTNITIDDQDLSIIYAPSGAWGHVTNGTTLDFGGAHMLTTNPAGTATFTFTGIAIYFMSPLWPYTVNTAISLDSGPSTLVDLTDPHPPSNPGVAATVQSQVVWQATGLANTQHKLLISVGAGQQYAIVDGLIYTTDVTASSSVSSAISAASTLPQLVSTFTQPNLASSISASDRTITSSTTILVTTPTTPVSSSSKSQPTLAIALGSAFGAVGLLVIFIALWWLLRRQKRPPPQPSTIDGPAYTSSIPTNPSMSAIRPNAMNNDGNWSGNQDNYRYHRIQPSDGRSPLYDNVGIPPSTGYGNAINYGGIQGNNLQQPPLNYYPSALPYNGAPSTSTANQPVSSMPLPPAPLHLQRRLSTPSTMGDNPPMYTRDSGISPDPSIMLDGSTTMSSTSSSRNGSTSEKSRNYGMSPRVSRNISIQFSDGADPEDTLISTAIPEGNETIQEGSEAIQEGNQAIQEGSEAIQGSEGRNTAWDGGYPQPLRFMPVT